MSVKNIEKPVFDRKFGKGIKKLRRSRSDGTTTGLKAHFAGRDTTLGRRFSPAVPRTPAAVFDKNLPAW